MKKWNREVFGNIFHRKNRIRSRLEGVRRAIESQSSVALLKLKEKLRDMWNDILQQEEVFWHQKSRVQWLTCGDGSTKFFQNSTIIRRKRNKIEGLMDDSH